MLTPARSGTLGPRGLGGSAHAISATTRYRRADPRDRHVSCILFDRHLDPGDASSLIRPDDHSFRLDLGSGRGCAPRAAAILRCRAGRFPVPRPAVVALPAVALVPDLLGHRLPPRSAGRGPDRLEPGPRPRDGRRWSPGLGLAMGSVPLDRRGRDPGRPRRDGPDRRVRAEAAESVPRHASGLDRRSRVGREAAGQS